MGLRRLRTLLYLIYAAFLLMVVTTFTEKLSVELEKTKLASQGAKSTSFHFETHSGVFHSGSRFRLWYCVLSVVVLTF